MYIPAWMSAIIKQKVINKAQGKPVAYAENFHGGVLVKGHMVVICIWCALFVTSQFDVMSMFPN